MNKDELVALLKAAVFLTPSSSRKKKREPVLVEHLVKMQEHFDLTVPLDAATFACLTTTFWGTARVGELTVTRLDAFHPDIHVTRSNVKAVQDRNGFKQTEFFLP
jgi:hypothetical protein